MKLLLLPHKFKRIGWFLLIPAKIVGIFLGFRDIKLNFLEARVFAILSGEIFTDNKVMEFIQDNIFDELVAIVFLVGAFFVGFSREKKEDEFISKLRLSSLLWAVYVNYALLFLAIVFIYGTAFLTVMIYNMFTILIIFIVRFNYLLYRNSKLVSDEK